MNVGFISLEVNEGSKDNWDGLRVLVDPEEIDLNVFSVVVLVKVSGEFIILLMGVTEEDDGLRI